MRHHILLDCSLAVTLVVPQKQRHECIAERHLLTLLGCKMDRWSRCFEMMRMHDLVRAVMHIWTCDRLRSCAADIMVIAA